MSRYGKLLEEIEATGDAEILEIARDSALSDKRILRRYFALYKVRHGEPSPHENQIKLEED